MQFTLPGCGLSQRQLVRFSKRSVCAMSFQDQLPFAVIGSDRYVTVSGKPVLGRKTKWGLIEVENKNHCEFSQLRDMLIKTHMQDLKEVTDNIHYENYRRTHLTEEKHEQIVLENNVVNMDDVMGQESKI